MIVGLAGWLAPREGHFEGQRCAWHLQMDWASSRWIWLESVVGRWVSDEGTVTPMSTAETARRPLNKGEFNRP